ncbi:MAG: hypothetical protein ACXW4B_10100 [Micavibrio sp.]
MNNKIALLTGEVPLTRKEAELYLLQKYGRAGAVTHKTLAKLATVGGGPVFQRFGRRIGYFPTALDEWVASRASNPMRSTSDHGGVPHV